MARIPVARFQGVNEKRSLKRYNFIYKWRNAKQTINDKFGICGSRFHKPLTTFGRSKVADNTNKKIIIIAQF